MCKHMFAAHVIEKMVICFPQQSIRFIYDIILDNFSDLACDSNGLCVIKKVLIHSSDPDVNERMKNIITQNAFLLTQDPYGNYAVQIALDYWKEDEVVPLISALSQKFVILSMQKFSSNVVEKCLEKSEKFGLQRFYEEIESMNRIADLMKNNYGNYVVQKALKLSPDVDKIKLVKLIISNIDNIGDKKLENKWRGIIKGYKKIMNNRFVDDYLSTKQC